MTHLGFNQYFGYHKGYEASQKVQMMNYVDIQQYIDLQSMSKPDQFTYQEDRKTNLATENRTDPTKRSMIQKREGEGSKTGIIVQQKFKDKYHEVYRGTKDDTVQLNINFKTLLVHHFRVLRVANELSQYEIGHVNDFNDRVASFSSLMLFFKDSEANRGIRQKSLELFSSSDCIKRVMSGRCKMKNKLQMIKFIEKVRRNILTTGKGYKWKDVIKKQL